MKKLILILLLTPVIVISQELNAKVSVNFEQLSTSAKDKLVDFEYAVEGYLNQTRFTNLDWEGEPIPCSFSIFFISSNGETQYSAQVVVTSQRPIYQSTRRSLMLSLMDKEWTFEYEIGQTLRYNALNFDPLTSLLDFYAHLIIGYDMDSYNPLGGSPFFDVAYDITLLGANSKFSKGWAFENSSYNKRKLLGEIQDGNYRQFRRDFFDYHYNGLDIYNDDKKTAQKNIAKLVDNLYKIIDKVARNSAILRIFFDAKAGELVEYLEGYNDQVFAKLMKINPENNSKYEKVLE